jgi:hypothetical protein
MAGVTCCKVAVCGLSCLLGQKNVGGCVPTGFANERSAFGSTFVPVLPPSFQSCHLSANSRRVSGGVRKSSTLDTSTVNIVRAGNKKKASAKSLAKKGGSGGTAVLEVEKEESTAVLELSKQGEEDLGDGFATEEEAKAYAAQFADFFNEEDDFEEGEEDEIDAIGNGFDGDEEDGPVEIDWEFGSDLGSKLGEVFDPIDLGLGKEWPKPWAEVPETYNWSTRTAARKEETIKLHRIDMSLLTADVSFNNRCAVWSHWFCCHFCSLICSKAFDAIQKGAFCGSGP